MNPDLPSWLEQIIFLVLLRHRRYGTRSLRYNLR